MLINSEIPILHYILNRLGIVYVMQKQLCYVAALILDPIVFFLTPTTLSVSFRPTPSHFRTDPSPNPPDYP